MKLFLLNSIVFALRVLVAAVGLVCYAALMLALFLFFGAVSVLRILPRFYA